MSRRIVSMGLCFALLSLVIPVTASVPGTETAKASSGSAQITRYHLDDPHTRTGFEYFYNLDYKRAIQEFEKALASHPDDAFAVNHLLSGVMFQELYRIGALDSELYAKEGFLTSKQYPIDPKTKESIKQLMDRALVLSEGKLKANPNDVDALYARGVTRGLKATYTALIDKAWFSALRSAVGARHDHERVLELQPNYTDAKMIVGMHNYVIGSLSWGVKVAASVVGLSGSRSKGIEYLYEAANGGGESSVDAKIALSLFLRREQRYKEAITLIDSLSSSYPHNFLVALELANLYNAGGQGPEAIASYRKILKAAEGNSYPDAHVEMAWYGLGEALRGQRDIAGAQQAYQKTLEYPKTDPDLRLRATLAAGEMCDVLQKRDEAIKLYQSVLAQDSDSPRAEQARRHLKQPYRLS
jgi:tetratricopeptide (TPR) repeat protein